MELEWLKYLVTYEKEGAVKRNGEKCKKGVKGKGKTTLSAGLEGKSQAAAVVYNRVKVQISAWYKSLAHTTENSALEGVEFKKKCNPLQVCAPRILWDHGYVIMKWMWIWKEGICDLDLCLGTHYCPISALHPFICFHSYIVFFFLSKATFIKLSLLFGIALFFY